MSEKEIFYFAYYAFNIGYVCAFVLLLYRHRHTALKRKLWYMLLAITIFLVVNGLLMAMSTQTTGVVSVPFVYE
jgi:drug/metabolite transporter (DMT)-like permease